ncbi:MAG: hypothetical protein IKS71_01835 [Bacteroidales bacterium]|nr:hypothetical protein [Bacteroidales bacterium]
MLSLITALILITLSPDSNARLDLKGDGWTLQRASEVEATGQQISSRRFDDNEWLRATVPGTVLTSFVNAGEYPEPTYDENINLIPESLFNSEFWYRDEFGVPPGFVGDKVWLNFDGINWKAEVWLNGKRLGLIEGAFTRAKFDVTDIVRKQNCLAVRIIPNANPGEVHPVDLQHHVGNGGILGLDNPTFHPTVGWDWIPTVPGRDIGIWGDVFITSTGCLSISDPIFRSELNLPDTTHAKVTVGATVTNSSRKKKTAVLTGKFGGCSFTIKENLAPGESRDLTTTVDVRDPELWWPNGYGRQCLQNVSLVAYDGRRVSDRTTFRAGIRQMTWSDEGGRLTLYVNGRRFMGKGGNWGFPELLLRYGEREYDIAVRLHAGQNFTMIRNWVGQTGAEAFFDACDRHGIMIWQDFWLANPADGPDPADEAMFMANADDFIRRIRRHPSIGLYCGRNEGMPPAILDSALARTVQTLHPGMLYIPHSATGLVSGYGPYNFKYPTETFGLWGQDRIHSERGMPNILNYESLARMLSAEHLWPQNDAWGLHDFVLASAQTCRTVNEAVERAFGWPESAEQFCKLAQWVNYDGYRAIFEGRSRDRRGLLLWMSHPAWPSMVWSTYDYWFDPTASYFGCKKGCEPLHVQYNPLAKTVEVVNVSAGEHPVLKVAAQWLDMWGKEISLQTYAIASAEDSTVEVARLPFPESSGEVCYLRLELAENDRTVGTNFYVQGREEYDFRALNELPLATVSTGGDIEDEGEEWKVTYYIANIGEVPALMLHAVVRDADGERVLPAYWSDNYVHLMPGESRALTVEIAKADCKGQPQVSLEGFNL